MMTFPRSFSALLLSLVLSIPVVAQEIVHAVALPRAAMGELAARPFLEQRRRIVHRHVPQFRARLEAPSSSGELSAPAVTIAPPPMTTVFDSDTSKNLTPPDATGAVGPAHVLSISNARIIVHDRDGNVLKTVAQSQFWSANSPSGVYYDPRAVYDAGADRWVMMTIFDEEAMMFAVSESGDPTGTWRRYQLSVSDCDFSMLAITRDTVVFGTLRWPSNNAVFASVQKQHLYAMPPTLPLTQYNVSLDYAQPVSTDRAVEYVVSSVSNNGIAVQRLGASSVRFIAEPPSWRTAEPYLPQLGTAFVLDGGYDVVQNAVERHGKIYVTLTRDAPGASSTIVWCKFDPDTGDAEWGSLTDPQGRVFAYPSIAVNRHGSMLIGFGHFSATQYAASGYIYRDFLGRVSTVAPIRAGETAVTFDDRWGDYTTTLVDPVDDASFWTTQIHAKNGTWATSWAKIEMPGGRRRSVRR
jgi:hypothetical protein